MRASSWSPAPCCSPRCGCSSCATCPTTRPSALAPPAPRAPTSRTLSHRGRPRRSLFLLVLGLVGGWFLAGRMLAPLTRITKPPAGPRPGRSPTGSSWRAATTSSASSPTPSTRCSRGSRPTSPSSSGSRPTPPTSCVRRWPSRRHSSTSPARTPSRDPAELVDRLHDVNARAIDLTEALLLLSRADQGPFTREPVDLSLLAEEATETLLPLAEKRGSTHRDLGRRRPRRSARPRCCCR